LDTCPAVWIAYSGGCDSHVLLHVAASIRAQLPPLRAIHVHHGLSPHADAWQAHCMAVCAALGIPLEVVRVHIEHTPGSSLEALARTARYQALQAQLQQGAALLSAHHANDQAETVLLQLMRGAGVAGLAAMPAQARLGDGYLLRPWLHVTQAELRAYAAAQKLTWIEDESNQQIDFERNFIRHQVLPLLQTRRAGVTHALARVAAHQAEAAHLLHEVGQHDLSTVLNMDLNHTPLPPLNLKKLVQLSPPRQRNVVRIWLHQGGFRSPSRVRLHTLLQQVFTAADDRQPMLCWDEGEIHRYRHHLYALPRLPTLPHTVLPWEGQASLPLPLGRLCATHTPGQGVYLPPQTKLEIRFRQGGERLLLNGQQHQLKKYLQKYSMPPWERHFLPLLYRADELVAVPGIAISDSFRAQGETLGWCFKWQVWF
jgi:tRNA(Ile)-lysidine synthase